MISTVAGGGGAGGGGGTDWAKAEAANESNRAPPAARVRRWRTDVARWVFIMVSE
jgi:hypothetical protein